MRLFLGFLVLLTGQLWAEQNAVILVYHHVDESSPRITSVSPQRFEQHLDYLGTAGFEVVSLSRILESIARGVALPPKTISISFDDAYESVYTRAFPALAARNWPFSVFVSSDAIDRAYGGFMSWDQLTEIAQYGAEIGGHTASHAHLVRGFEGETLRDWQQRVADEIDQGNSRIEEVLRTKVKLFAYPYGEFNQQLKELLKERNLFGLAQHSGAVGELTDLYAVPRYPMAASYANMDRFTLVVNTKALPVAAIDAGDLVRIQGQDSGQLQLSLVPGDYQLVNLACYSASGTALEVTTNDLQISVDLPEFSPGRAKINCTAPSAVEGGVYYWFSHQWIVKSASGQWPAE